MSYCTLPRKQTICKLNPRYKKDTSPLPPTISFSLLHYLKTAQEQIRVLQSLQCTENPEYNIDLIHKVVNPYEFVHSRVPGSKFSVSKVKASSANFYTFMEIVNSFNVFESFNDRNIKSLHCGKNNTSTIDCMNIFRENNNDCNYDFYLDATNFTHIVGVDVMTIDFLYFELNELIETGDINECIIEFVNIMCYILTYQNVNGLCIIKVDSIFFKPILEIIYLLTNMYEKVYIIKPNVSNVLKNERFIVCKNFISDCSKTLENNNILKILKTVLVEFNCNGNILTEILDSELPYYFLNKIEESNIITGQQQLEHLDHVVNTIKNKNREDKIETLKKNNIQKCIQWCEKNKIPYNKFVDKLNIFLPVTICEIDNITHDINDNDSITYDINDNDSITHDTNHNVIYVENIQQDVFGLNK
jgi:hypothetical protein